MTILDASCWCYITPALRVEEKMTWFKCVPENSYSHIAVQSFSCPLVFCFLPRTSLGSLFSVPWKLRWHFTGVFARENTSRSGVESA